METPDEQLHEQIRMALRTADVLSIFFVRVGQSMIIDTRGNEETGPAVILDEIVASPRERLDSMRRLRPGLPLPEHMTLAPWTAAVRDFESTGMLETVLERCRLVGGEPFDEAARRAYRRLAAIERRFMRDLVLGVGMKTIWSRDNS
jgi:hypothetical protein